LQTALSATMTVALLIAVAALLSMANPTASIQTASAEGGPIGGVINENQYAPLLAGTTRYTTSLVYSPPAVTKGFGSVQIMLNSIVTGSQTITVTPQFSLQGTACPSVTQWFSATTYLYYQPYSIATSSTTLTETIGAWQATPLIEQFVLTGPGTKGREVSIQGQCMRLQLQFSNPGQSYTPTLVIRALNRN
jgi:hypothetical protein